MTQKFSSENQLNKIKMALHDLLWSLPHLATAISKKLAAAECVKSHTHHTRPKVFCQHLSQA